MLGSGLQHELVYITMESVIGEIEQFIDPGPVVVHLVAVIAELVLIAVFEGQNSGSSRVQPIAWVLFAVACD
jgi:hypothetical protein